MVVIKVLEVLIYKAILQRYVLEDRRPAKNRLRRKETHRDI